MKATKFLKQVVARRKSPGKPTASGAFSLAEFSEAMSECLKVFSDELGGHVSMSELGTNLRLTMFTRTGVEQSDLLYKEFYPKRETAELVKAIGVLKAIAAKRKNGGGYGSTINKNISY